MNPLPAAVPGPSAGLPFAVRRVRVRYPCPPGTLASVHPCAARWPTRALECLSTGLLLDTSGSGLGLLLAFPAGRGAILEVDLFGLPARRTLLVRVVHVSERSGGWLHGCEAANPLSDDELREVLQG